MPIRLFGGEQSLPAPYAACFHARARNSTLWQLVFPHLAHGFVRVAEKKLHNQRGHYSGDGRRDGKVGDHDRCNGGGHFSFAEAKGVGHLLALLAIRQFAATDKVVTISIQSGEEDPVKEAASERSI